MSAAITFSIFLLFTHSITLAEECGKALSSRIVGGVEVGGYKYPWYALLRIKSPGDPPGCGGTLITSKHVLTAAHCFGIKKNTSNEEQFTVALGSYDRCAQDGAEETRQVFNVARAVVHEDFSLTERYHDIALITLDGTADSFTVACLPPAGKNDKNEPGLVMGYGVTYEGGFIQPCHMMEANVTKYTSEQCKMANLPGHEDEEETVFCGGAEGRGTCQGDSGGPFLTSNSDGNFVVTGVTSYGYGCARYPAIYTNVGSYLDWIQEKIDESEQLFHF